MFYWGKLMIFSMYLYRISMYEVKRILGLKVTYFFEMFVFEKTGLWVRPLPCQLLMTLSACILHTSWINVDFKCGMAWWWYFFIIFQFLLQGHWKSTREIIDWRDRIRSPCKIWGSRLVLSFYIMSYKEMIRTIDIFAWQ